MNLSSEDFEYYQRRAEAQLELAQRTDNGVAVAAHCAIADRYLELCEPARLQDAATDDTIRLKPLPA